MNVECRGCDIVVRITDWMKDPDEPGFDVEFYISGSYVQKESGCFTIHQYKTQAAAKLAAVSFVQSQIAKLTLG